MYDSLAYPTAWVYTGDMMEQGKTEKSATEIRNLRLDIEKATAKLSAGAHSATETRNLHLDIEKATAELAGAKL